MLSTRAAYMHGLFKYIGNFSAELSCMASRSVQQAYKAKYGAGTNMDLGMRKRRGLETAGVYTDGPVEDMFREMSSRMRQEKRS